jgi:methyltransferase (TIGR00027 family)
MTRTDNDTWDLASGVGATATMVAAGRARAHRAGLLDDWLAEPLVRAVGIDFFTRWAAAELDAADVDIPGHQWGMQPITDQLTVRTPFIDKFFADAAAGGVRQVVLFASGLDARAYRLSWPAGMTVFDNDQPQVLEFKAATMAEFGAEPAAELRTVPIDLRQDWPSALRQAGFDPARPTAWLAEGLLALLPPAAQDRFLDDITELSADGSRLLAEIFLDFPGAAQVTQAAFQRWYERGLDVHIGDLGYHEDRNDVATYLQGRGWHTTNTRLGELLTDAGLAVPPRNDSEPSIADNYYCIATLSR